ncbi:MAG: cytochrome c-type biogenesis CcmF C-terminal domain-containing protein, partial [Acidobacteriota bacterium]
LFAWRKTSLKSLRRSCILPLILAFIAGIALVAGGMRNLNAIICLALCVFVLGTIFEEFFRGALVRVKSRKENFLAALLNLTLKNKRRYGGYIIHLAVVLMFAGFAGNAFNREATEYMKTGQEFQLGDYSLKMTGFQEGQTPNYDYGRVVLDVYKDGKKIDILKPEKRIFKTGSRQTTTTVALRSTPKEDLYVVFAGMLNDRVTCEIKANVNPLVYWIWIGAAVMVFGTVVTLLPDRKSVVVREQIEDAP